MRLRLLYVSEVSRALQRLLCTFARCTHDLYKWCSPSTCAVTIPGHWHRHVRTQSRFYMSCGASLLPSTLRFLCHSKTNSNMSKAAITGFCCASAATTCITCDRMSRALLHVKAARLGLQSGPCTLSAHTRRPFIYSIYHRGDLPSELYSGRRWAIVLGAVIPSVCIICERLPAMNASMQNWSNPDGARWRWRNACSLWPRSSRTEGADKSSYWHTLTGHWQTWPGTQRCCTMRVCMQ